MHIVFRVSLGIIDEKDPRCKRGRRNCQKKNLRCATCSPQVWTYVKKRSPLQTRAAKLPKEKPAVRDLLTAGVGLRYKKIPCHKRE